MQMWQVRAQGKENRMVPAPIARRAQKSTNHTSPTTNQPLKNNKKTKKDATSDNKNPGTCGVCGGWLWFAGGADAQQKEDPDRLAMRPHRPDAACRHGVLSRRAGLREPDQLEGWHRRLQGPHQRARQQLPGAVGDRGIRAAQAGRRGLHPDLGHAAGRGAEPRLQKDQIPGTSPGFGSSAAANGAKYPYLFPLAATYWSQAAAAIKFVKDKLGGSLKGKKIAYLYYDNPAGTEPLPILKELQQNEGFDLRTFAVPPPGVEMSAQILDIAQRYRPDFVLAHLFGRAPSVMLKSLKSSGYPLSKVLGFVWASSEADIAAAGGWPLAQGYHTMQFVGVGNDYPVLPGNQGDVPEGGQGAAEGNGRPRSTTTAASRTPPCTSRRCAMR